MIINVSEMSVFFLSGLHEMKHHRSALFFLSLLCYCITILLNVCLILIIILDKSLHEPMYIMLCAFCMNGLYGTAGFYPKFLWDLLSPVHIISYSGCLVQAQVIYSFVSSDLSILAVMAYDRYLAICRPLEYHSVMSNQRVVKLVCVSWLTPFCIAGTNIFLASRLKLCSPFISRLLCMNWSIVALACFPAETVVNNIVTNITIIIYAFHAFFIIWSYMYLIKTCVNSLENRAKFMQTCVPHLISLLTFTLTKLFDIITVRLSFRDLPQSLQNFIAIAFLVIPPIMNPLIYGFKMTIVWEKILKFVSFKNAFLFKS